MGDTYMNTGNAASVPIGAGTGQPRTKLMMCGGIVNLANLVPGCLCIIPVSGMDIAETGNG